MIHLIIHQTNYKISHKTYGKLKNVFNVLSDNLSYKPNHLMTYDSFDNSSD